MWTYVILGLICNTILTILYVRLHKYYKFRGFGSRFNVKNGLCKDLPASLSAGLFAGLPKSLSSTNNGGTKKISISTRLSEKSLIINSDSLLTEWLKIPSTVTSFLFKEDPSLSYYSAINNTIIAGITNTSLYEEYSRHFDDAVYALLTSETNNDILKFVRIYAKSKRVIDSYIEKNDLKNKKKYQNINLMSHEIFCTTGMEISLMRYKLRKLNSVVFATTTNRTSAKIMEACGYELIESWNYSEFGINPSDKDEAFNVYVWYPWELYIKRETTKIIKSIKSSRLVRLIWSIQSTLQTRLRRLRRSIRSPCKLMEFMGLFGLFMIIVFI
jgi:hypothetical protein